MISKFIENLVMNKMGGTMKGGGSNNSGGNGTGFYGFYVFFFSLFMLIIKSFLVMISYNLVIPRILVSYNVNMTQYRPITFIEGLLLVILFNNLFNYF